MPSIHFRHGITSIRLFAMKKRITITSEDGHNISVLIYSPDKSSGLPSTGDLWIHGGESAGGGLCAALCMLARNRGEVNIAFQMPLYPMIDDRDTDSSRDNHNLVLNTSGWLKSPEGTAPEVRNAPNRGRRRKSAGVKESRRG